MIWTRHFPGGLGRQRRCHFDDDFQLLGAASIDSVGVLPLVLQQRASPQRQLMETVVAPPPREAVVVDVIAAAVAPAAAVAADKKP